MKKLLFWLKVSRPGLWFASVWLYLLPTSQMDLFGSGHFWLGLVYSCFPLNFLIYGWNDIVDFEIDRGNPRKDTFWFGARGTADQLARLWKPILAVQLLFVPLFIFLKGWKMLALFAILLIINALYNWPGRGLRSRPPWELVCQIGYLLVVPFSILLNDTASLPWATYLYLLLFAFQSQLIGEVMDIAPDRQAGRQTTATRLGVRTTKWLIIAIVALEAGLMLLLFEEWYFGGFLCLAMLWLLLDVLVLYKTTSYRVEQMKLFGLLSNVVAIGTMAYVWYSGCLG